MLEVPTLSTVDDQGQPVMEKYFKPGSTIVLRCLVINYRPEFQAPVWRRENSLESRLYLSKAGRGDTGRYSCHIPGLEKPLYYTR